MRRTLRMSVPAAALVIAGSLLAAGCNNEKPVAAKAAASTTVGNEIDDTVVTARVKSALLKEDDVKSFDLKVETRKGKVQLTGFVDTQVQLERAVALTRTVEGVTSVENGIALKSGVASVGNAVDDDVITAKVKSGLLGEPNMKSMDIAVLTRKGEVQLSGFVNNQAQVDSAIAVAKGVSGVTKVDNKMSIKK